VCQVEEERAPLEDRPIDLDLGGGLARRASRAAVEEVAPAPDGARAPGVSRRPPSVRRQAVEDAPGAVAASQPALGQVAVEEGVGRVGVGLVGEHPSQALLDMFTILDMKTQLDGLNITMVGDLKHGRTVHSLAKLIARLEGGAVIVNCVSPPSLRLPDGLIDRMRATNITVRETDILGDVLAGSDVIYWTRVQEERFDDRTEYEAIKDGFIMTAPVLAQAKTDAILMHPLPRKHEMGTPEDHDVLDLDPRAIYFQQMENGMFVRMALLAKVLRGVYV